MFIQNATILLGLVAAALVIWLLVVLRARARSKAQDAILNRLANVEQSLPANASYAAALLEVRQAHADIATPDAGHELDFGSDDQQEAYLTNPMDPTFSGRADLWSTESVSRM